MYYGYKSLIDILFANIFSYSLGCIFTFLVVSLSVQMVLILMKLNLFFFPVVVCAFGVLFKKVLPTQGHKDIPMFSSKIFIGLALPFRCLIHFELTFVYSIRKGSNYILFTWCLVFQNYLLKILLSSLNYLGTLV